MFSTAGRRGHRLSVRALLCLLAGTLLLSRTGRSAPADFMVEYVLRPAGKATRSQAKPPGSQTRRPLTAILEARLPILTARSGSVRLVEDGTALVRVPEFRIADSQMNWFRRRGVFQVVWLPGVRGGFQTDARYEMTITLVQDKRSVRCYDLKAGRFVPVATLLKSARPVVDGGSIEPGSASLLSDDSYPVVQMKFDPAGTRRLASFAVRHPGQMLAFLLDGEIVAGPIGIPPRSRVLKADGKITEGEGPWEDGTIQIAPFLASRAEARYLAAILNGGPLAAPLEIVETRQVVDGQPEIDD